MKMFNVSSDNELGQNLMECVLQNNKTLQNEFIEMVGDLSVDWLQMIFQYYQADRKEKKQDYTPKTMAKLLAVLIGDTDRCVDLCAGSGALTIQKWNVNHETFFILYEFDENVIPYLLFNMAIRKINCIVYHADVLQMEIFNTYELKGGEAIQDKG